MTSRAELQAQGNKVERYHTAAPGHAVVANRKGVQETMGLILPDVSLRRDHQTERCSVGSQYTSWAFGRRLRAAGLLGSMGSIGDAYDTAMAESFFETLRVELLAEHHWVTRRKLALAILEWIEARCNIRRPGTSIGSLSPIGYKAAHRGDVTANAA